MSKFDKMYDVNKLKESYEKAKENGNGDRPEIPVGKYEVKVENIWLGETQNGAPKAVVQFKIVAGEYKDEPLYYNQTLVGINKETGELSAFGTHKCDEFLKSLEPVDKRGKLLKIEFKDFDQYEQLLLDCAEGCEGVTYEIQYGKKNDFPTFKVLNIYED